MKTKKSINPSIHQSIKAALVVAAASCCVSVAQAAIIGTYDFTGANGHQVSTAANFSAAGITVGSITRGAAYAASGMSAAFTANGISASPGLATTNSAFLSNYTLATAIANDGYFEFSVSADAGYEFDIDSITFGARRASGGTGANNLALRSSLDGFSTNLATQGITGTAADPTEVIFNLGESVQSVTGTVVFRIYGYARTAANANYGILVLSADSNAPFTINGSVSAIPEPGSFAVLAGAAAVAVAGLRRRRR